MKLKLKSAMSKLGFFDRVLLILGFTLAGVIAFVLVAGVIVALLKMFLDPKQSEKAPALLMNSKAPHTGEPPISLKEGSEARGTGEIG